MSNKEYLSSTGTDIAPGNPLALGNDANATDEVGYGCLYTLEAIFIAYSEQWLVERAIRSPRTVVRLRKSRRIR